MNTGTVREAVTRSPWWDDHTVARLLHRAAADGAIIQNAQEFGCDVEELEAYGPEEAEWFLNVTWPLPRQNYATVRYTSQRGCWVLIADTDTIDSDLDQQMSAAYAVGLAARLCRDLNARLNRQRSHSHGSALSSEIEALMADRDLTPSEFAVHLGVTYGVLMSKISGATHWSATDLARAATAFARGTDRADVLDRLLEIVDA